MNADNRHAEEQYICDECGYTSPVANERCPECGALMSALHDEKSKTKIESGESEADLADEATNEDGATSLEVLQNKEQEESDKEYQNDAFGSE